MSHKTYRTETNCLNCGEVVRGKFCSACGQENVVVQESFPHLVGHFFADYFHYDSKFLRSMKYLFLRPGFLTKQYWEGKRVDYIHPLRLYFFVVIIGVLLGGWLLKHYEREFKSRAIKITASQEGQAPQELDVTSLKDPMAMEQYKRMSQGLDRFGSHFKYVLFGLLPVYALIFKILYFRRKSFFVDHLIYAIHLQSFVFLLRLGLGAFGLLIPILDSPLRWISYGLIIAYTAISLRYLYHQSWPKTILKSLIATLLIVTSIFVVVGVYVAIEFIGYQGK